MKEKVFLIFNTAALGDVLLCNSLCQNIHSNFLNSKVVFIVDKPYEDAAKYQQGADEVIIFDKTGEHKGFIGIYKFIKNFPYKKAYCSFIIYRNERNFLISMLLGSKKTVMAKKAYSISVQLAHTMLLKNLPDTKIKNLPIKYNVPLDILNGLNADNDDYIVLCSVSKNPEKDMPPETAVSLVQRLNTTPYKVFFTGAGSKAEKYAEILTENGCKFKNLVNKTSIKELSGVLKRCKCLISVDTGTMHMGCAVGCPVVSIFYRKHTVPVWAPNPELYKSIVIFENQTPENIYNQTLELLKNNADTQKEKIRETAGVIYE